MVSRQLRGVLNIITDDFPQLKDQTEIEIDLGTLPTKTLRRLEYFTRMNHPSSRSKGSKKGGLAPSKKKAPFSSSKPLPDPVKELPKEKPPTSTAFEQPSANKNDEDKDDNSSYFTDMNSNEDN